jgi:hypothetical protein
MAQVDKKRDCCVDRSASGRRQRRLRAWWWVRGHRNAQSTCRAAQGITKRARSPVSYCDIEEEGSVAEGAGEGAEDEQAVPRRGVFGANGEAIALGLHADETGESCGVAD